MNSENIFAIKSKDSEILESNEETIQANESSTAKALNILKTTLDIAFDVIIGRCSYILIFSRKLHPRVRFSETRLSQ